MTFKLTESKLEILIDTLNAIICGEVNITREQRENMVRTVATLGGLTERQRLITADVLSGFADDDRQLSFVVEFTGVTRLQHRFVMAGL